ncbi:MAG: VanW family protein [Euzebya sp.]
MRDDTKISAHAHDKNTRSEGPAARVAVMDHGSEPPGWRPTMKVESAGRSWKPVAAVLGAIGLLAVVGVVMATRLPGGSTLAGTPVGSADDAVGALRSAQQRLDQLQFRFVTTVGSQSTVAGSDLGLTVDQDASRAPVGRGIPSLQAWARRIPEGPLAAPLVARPLPPETLTQVARDISRDPVDAQVEVTAAGVQVEQGQDGIHSDPGQVEAAIDEALDGIATLPVAQWPAVLEVQVDGPALPPMVAQADIDAVRQQITRLEQAEVQVTADTSAPPTDDDGGSADDAQRIDTTITLSPQELRSMVDVEVVAGAPDGARLALVPDTEKIPARVIALMDLARIPATVTAMIENRSPTPERNDDLIDVSDITGDIVVEGSEAGFEPDREATLAAIVMAGLDGGGDVDVIGQAEIESDPADLGIVEPVSTFTTFYTAGQSRVQNIMRIAEIVDGTIIPPGESYELNHAVGRRTVENGFTLGGAILDGELVSDVGGGVSQFATTFFNAAWFAGVDLVDFKAHSFYFSRYPAGREATVNFPNVNLEIRNNTPYAILIDTDTDATSVTVTFWSTPYWDVQTITGPCACGGAFSITVDRIRSAEGGEPIEESFTTYYTVPRDQ